MRISRVTIFQLNWGQLAPIWHPVVVTVQAENGQCGWGEAGVAYGTGATGAVGIIKELAPRIIGRNVWDSNAIWTDFYEHTFWAKNPGSIMYAAISALDTAIWDLKARLIHQPLYQLLGGKVRDQLPAYASHIEYGWGPFSRYVTAPRDFARLAQRAVDQGYFAIKVDPITQERGQSLVNNRRLLSPAQLDCYYQRVAAIRHAVGPGVRIIIDCHANLTRWSAQQLVRRLAPLGIDYYEELLPTIDPTQTVQLARATGASLAVGEHLAGPQSYLPLIKDVSMVQPDLGNCGGITAAVKIAALAAANGTGMQLHVCGSPIATAAALQFEAACNSFVIHEEHEINLKAANYQSGKYHYQPVDGHYRVPDRPGIGQELSPLAIKQARATVIK
ncbi:MAG: mandelate racemase/muconate lactonizing enzyme family protein [Limosilactobacillus sp.]